MNGIAIKKVLLFSERGFVRSPRQKRRKNTPVTARWQFIITGYRHSATLTHRGR